MARTLKFRGYLLAALLILLIAAPLRILHLNDASFTVDEVYTHRRTLGSLEDRLQDIAGPGNHVPLYFLSVGLLPHDYDFEMRLLGVFFGLLGLSLFMSVTRNLYRDDKFVLLAGLTLAVNPYLVQYDRNARPYPLVFFFGLLASYLFFKLLRGHASPRLWIAFTLTSLAAYLSHYSAAALPLSQFIILIWTRRASRQTLTKWFIAQTLASFPIFLWILLYASPKGDPNDWIEVPNIWRPYYTITNIAIGYTAHPTWYFLIALIFITLGLAAGIRHAYRNAHTRPVDAYWLVLGFIPMLLLFLISQIRPLYVERYFTVTAPAIFLLMFLGWRNLTTRPLFEFASLTLILIGAGITIHTLRTTAFEPRDWKHSTAYMKTHLQPHDAIILDTWFTDVFWYYDQRESRFQVIPSDTERRLFDDEISLSDLPYQRIWIFAHARPQLSPEKRAWLENHIVIERVDFYQISLYLLHVPTRHILG